MGARPRFDLHHVKNPNIYATWGNSCGPPLFDLRTHGASRGYAVMLGPSERVKCQREGIPTPMRKPKWT